MLVTTATPATSAAPSRSVPVPRPHLWQVDVVRLLTFAAVISVHSLAFTEQPDNRVAAGAMMLLQFGREIFYALTGFVLIWSTWDRPLRVGSFWRRRIAYVAIPYVVWSAIYYAYTVWNPPRAPFSISDFGWDLLYGGAEYHLYFLLVTLQVYLAFPLIRRLVRRTAAHALPTLAAVSAVNLAWTAVVAYVPAPVGWPGWFWVHAYEILPTYSMYVLAGCYAAVHFDRLQDLFERHTRTAAGIAGGSAVLALTAYAVQLSFMAPRTADQVVQPFMIFSCAAAVIAVYWVGWRWASGRRRHQKTIAVLSDASFGVYLAHPLVLQLLTDYAGLGNNGQVLPSWAATIIAYVVTAAGGTALSLAARRTPLSLALAGRPWRSR
jgi:peptidoglycan/LPS O-acetylase OafA/YrhL